MFKYLELSMANSCFNKAKYDEIIFVLLERDESAPDAIREWIKSRIRKGLNVASDAKLVEAESCAQQIENRHRGKSK
jgi:hypothetical protein